MSGKRKSNPGSERAGPQALSQADIDELLTAISTAPAESGSQAPRAPRERHIAVYDFAAPPLLDRTQVRAIEVANELFARRATELLARRTHLVCKVAHSSVDQIVYRSLLASAPNPGMYLRFLMSDRSVGALAIEPVLLHLIIDALMGGVGENIKRTSAATAIDREVIFWLGEELVELLGRAWGLAPTLVSAECEPAAMMVAEPGSRVVRSTIECTVAEVTATLCLCLGQGAAREAAESCAASLGHASGSSVETAGSRLSRISADDLEVDAYLVAKTEPRTIGELAELEVGSRIRIGEAEPLSLLMVAGGATIARFELASPQDSDAIVVQPAKKQKPSTTAEIGRALSDLEQRVERRLSALESAVVSRLDRLSRHTIQTPVATGDKAPRRFSFLTELSDDALSRLLRSEHPQVTAAILSYLPAARAAAAIMRFPSEVQAEVSRRIAVLDRIDGALLDRVEAAASREVAFSRVGHLVGSGGIQQLAQLLKAADRATEHSIIESLEEDDPELAEKLKEALFTFADIVSLDDRTVQRILREVDERELCLALPGSSEEVSGKVFANMSKKAGELLREEIDLMGPVRVRDAEAAQRRIVAIIRRLEASGEIDTGPDPQSV